MLKNKRLLIALAAGVVVLVVLGSLSFVVQNSDVQVSVVSVPEDATITIDGQPTKTGKITLKRGDHTVKATRQYFLDYDRKINTKDLTDGKIYIVMTTSSPEGLKWLSDHPGDPQLRQQAGDAEATAVQNELHDDYPFLTKFPFESIDYKIDYTLSPDRKTLTFQVTLLPYALRSNEAEYKQQLHDFKAEALKFLSDNGVDIKKYPITYDPDEAKDL